MLINFTQQTGNLAGRARRQFRTGLVCLRFFPDPPGNVFAECIYFCKSVAGLSSGVTMIDHLRAALG